LALWALANGSTNIGEKENAVAALRRLQREHELSDVQLAYIAEREQHRSRDDRVSLLEAIIELTRITGVMLEFEQAIVIALWTLHTHVNTVFLQSPRLIVRSDDSGHGKSATLSFIRELADGSYKTVSPTAAVVFRRLKRERTTFLIDEGEYSRFLSDRDLRSLFDAGYEQGNSVSRVNHMGEEEEFPTFFPLALAAVIRSEELTRQQLSRSVVLDMVKHSEGRSTIWPGDQRFTSLRRLIREWAGTFRAPEDTELPQALTDRLADNWRVLVSIADSLGYGATARAVALFFHRPHDDPVIRLLLDIFSVFERLGVDRIWRDELLEALHGMPDANWGEFRGITDTKDVHKLTTTELYDLLRTKNVLVRPVRKRNKFGRGFHRRQFEPAWSALGVTPSHASEIIALPRYDKRHVDGTDTPDDSGKE
jgi:hypothetical protein